MIIEWADINSVNIKKIDAQHKRLVGIINNLSEIGDDKAKIRMILDELGEYASYHFNTEENLFKKYEYPLENQHKAEHQFYKDQIKKFDTQYRGDTQKLAKNMIKFLGGWWLNHINKSDVEYSEFLNSQGVY